MDDALEMEYPSLYQLVGAYLNQDYTINGPELEDSVQAFVEDSTLDDVRAARDDIARFQRDRAGHLDEAMDELVQRDWARLPGTTARDYLLWLDRLLAAALGN